MKKTMDVLKKISLPHAIIVAGILIAIAIFFVNNGIGFNNKSLSSEQAGKIGMDYINDVLLQQSKDKGVLKTVVEVSGMYKISFTLLEKEESAYISKDGKFLMPMSIEIKPAEKAADQKAVATKCEDVAKTDSALLEPFVVSGCPYGLQLQRVAAEIVKNIPELAANIKIRYIGEIVDGKITSMHGDAEAVENLNQICIREEQPTKYWPYVSCYMQKGEDASCLKSTGVDQAKLSACVKDANKGLAYAKVDFDLTAANSVTSSPTLFLNGAGVDESSFGGRTAQAVKEALCCGFTNKPSFCSKSLTTDAAAPGFSATYKAAANATQNGGATCN